MAPRPKQTYEEREPDSTGTPFERFERALRKVISTPKERAEQKQGRPVKKPRASA